MAVVAIMAVVDAVVVVIIVVIVTLMAVGAVGGVVAAVILAAIVPSSHGRCGSHGHRRRCGRHDGLFYVGRGRSR